MRSEVFKYGPTEPRTNPEDFDGFLKIMKSRSNDEILEELEKIGDELLDLAVRLEKIRTQLEMALKTPTKRKKFFIRSPFLDGVDKYGTVAPRKQK